MEAVLDVQPAVSSPAEPLPVDITTPVSTEDFTPEERQAWLKDGSTPQAKKAEPPPAKETAVVADPAPAKAKQEKPETEARFSELLNQRKTLFDENTDLKKRLEALEKGVKTDPPPAKTEPKADTSKRMTMEEYIKANPDHDYEQYEAYRDGFVIEQAKLSLKADQEAAAAKAKETEQHESAAKTVGDRLERAGKKYADLTDVITNPTLVQAISPPMNGYLFEFDKDLEIQYYLGQHLDEAANIAKMTPIGQIVALQRIGGKLYPEVDGSATATPPPAQPKLSAAKPIGTHVGGNNSATDEDALPDGNFNRNWMDVQNRKDIARRRGH